MKEMRVDFMTNHMGNVSVMFGGEMQPDGVMHYPMVVVFGDHISARKFVQLFIAYLDHGEQPDGPV